MKSIFFLLTFLLGTTTIQCALNSTLFIGCGVNKTCIATIPGSCSTACTPSTCRLLYTIQNLPNEDKLHIELHSDGNYAYMALGFSDDQRMPNTDVIGCDRSDSSTAFAKDTFNNEYFNFNDGDNSTLSNFTFTIDADYFFCAFDRTYLPQDSSRGFALNTGSYFIFSANRNDISANNGQLARFERHTITPCISDNRIDPLELTNVLSTSPDYSLVRTHGMLMILAWSVFIATGVFIANYSRSSLPNGEWFHLHKFINGSAVVIALVALVIIFVAVGEWRRGSATLWAHQLIGLGAIFAMVANPTIAAFRCRPTAKYRWIFRYIHLVVGYIAIVLATITICLGLVLYYTLVGDSSSSPPPYVALWIFVAKIVADFAFHIPLILYFCYKAKLCKEDENCKKDGEKKPLEKVNPVKLFLHNIFAPPQCPTGEDRKKPYKDWPIILGVVGLYVIYNICVYIAIIIAVVLA